MKKLRCIILLFHMPCELLYLTVECPLPFYSLIGKITIGTMGLFTTGLFSIYIGILGSGFNIFVEEEEE